MSQPEQPTARPPVWFERCEPHEITDWQGAFTVTVHGYLHLPPDDTKMMIQSAEAADALEASLDFGRTAVFVPPRIWTYLPLLDEEVYHDQPHNIAVNIPVPLRTRDTKARHLLLAASEAILAAPRDPVVDTPGVVLAARVVRDLASRYTS